MPGYILTLYQPMMYICVMSVLLFFHKSIRIYMEVIILGANTLYNVFCFFKAFLPERYGWERVKCCHQTSDTTHCNSVSNGVCLLCKCG